jgi:hypothetical protein|tara:strand:- start:324 stop:515 length:192 start_codon:yes stop_codon:yes gene_type:complete
MATKITGYRFDEDFIKILKTLARLERLPKTEIIKKAVVNYLTENIDRLEERHKKMNKMGFWVN